jgi:hypothetical protein
VQFTEEAEYRISLADGFLREARQDQQQHRWRSRVDNCQLATENAAKAVMAMVGPVGATHEPGVLRLAILHDGIPSAIVGDALRRLEDEFWFLHVEGGIYSFSNLPNSNRVIVEKEEAVKDENINGRWLPGVAVPPATVHQSAGGRERSRQRHAGVRQRCRHAEDVPGQLRP